MPLRPALQDETNTAISLCLLCHGLPSLLGGLIDHCQVGITLSYLFQELIRASARPPEVAHHADGFAVLVEADTDSIAHLHDEIGLGRLISVAVNSPRCDGV